MDFADDCLGAEEEFGISYHPGHVRKLVRALGFSLQRPRCVPARADGEEQDRGHS